MAIDNKYGRVELEHGSIGEDEPVVVFRARDLLLPEVLDYYEWLCEQNGAPRRHIMGIRESAYKVRRWQEHHDGQMPTSEESRAWRPNLGE